MPGRTQGETLDDALDTGSPPSRREPHLVVVLDGACPTSGSSRHSLADVQEVTLGRADMPGFVRRMRDGKLILEIGVASSIVSSEHARIVRQRSVWIIEDLGSRNGTRVNGVCIERATLREGDVIELARTFLLFHEAVLVPADTPPDETFACDVAAAFATVIPELAARMHALKRIAQSSVPVLLLGETGTGKEIAARAIHERSGRTGAFVPVNCGALPRDLVEALLFGHVRGAFSGAVRDEIGFIRAAHGGTLLLDEIGELAPPVQAALLRVLQEDEVVAVGGSRPVKIDVRVIAATHRDVVNAIERGNFRSDLYARIAGFSFVLPPLRERRDDLGLIVGRILRELCGGRAEQTQLTPEVVRALLRFDWPRNIRELRQAFAAALVLATGDTLVADHLPGAVTASLASSVTAPPAQRSEESDENARLRTLLIRELREHRGNVTAVARAMSKAPMQVYRWIRRFGIEPNDYR